ncbi:MAG: hypothetical protein QS721_09800 [Candidatus Endonucleobacter sp. (ex Gigantidas childressi)]|nr:hypothetical protein [Candidatus Endonucleobacter sp. (ex Gigantidas childressi)]
MKLKIKAKALVGCLMASLLFATPLLAGFQLSLAKVSDVNRESLKAYVDEVLDRNADNSILFSGLNLVMYKEIFYVSLVQNCTEDVCNYDKKKVDAVIDENTDSATQMVYDDQVGRGATNDELYVWKEKNLCSQDCDFSNILKKYVENITVITEGSNHIFIMDMVYKSKIIIIFDSAGSIIGIKYEEVDAHHKYDVAYIITSSAITMRVSEYTFREDLLDSTESKSVLGGMVTNFEATVTLDHDGNVIKKAGKIYVYNKLLSCLGHQFELKDDTLSSAANGNYVSIDELFTATEPTVTASGDGEVQNLSYHHIDARAGNGGNVSIDELSGNGGNVSMDEYLSNWDNVSIDEFLGNGIT